VWRDDGLARARVADVERRADERRRRIGDALPPERPRRTRRRGGIRRTAARVVLAVALALDRTVATTS
jgi:hypothetical protein